MRAHFQDLHVGQRITVIYRDRFTSRLVVGAYVGREHDTLVIRCDDQDHDTHIPEGDLISVGRHARRPGRGDAPG